MGRHRRPIKKTHLGEQISLSETGSDEVVDDGDQKCHDDDAHHELASVPLKIDGSVNRQVARGELVQFVDVALVSFVAVGGSKHPTARVAEARIPADEHVSKLHERVLPGTVAALARLFAVLGVVLVLAQARAHVWLRAVATRVLGALPSANAVLGFVAARVVLEGNDLILENGRQLRAGERVGHHVA